MNNQIIFEPLAGGFVWTLSGGTRMAIKLNRPWQKPLETLINPSKCPFCTKPQEKIELPGIPDGWRLLPNPMTPHKKHRLIGPTTCWTAEKLQVLGGAEEIENALKICRLAIAEDKMEIALVTHVGWLAGQNLGHNHWHLCDAQVRKSFEPSKFLPKQDRIVSENDGFLFVADGGKPGQVQIIPKGWTTVYQLASAINWIIKLGNDKFRSTDQELSPEYAITVRISFDHKLRYACYCPQLAPPSCGFHHTIAAFEGGPDVLPWTHETTAAYLRGD